jgi:hypothetical protein
MASLPIVHAGSTGINVFTLWMLVQQCQDLTIVKRYRRCTTAALNTMYALCGYRCTLSMGQTILRLGLGLGGCPQRPKNQCSFLGTDGYEWS